MPHGLVRFQQAGHLHFITFSCFHRLPYLASPEAKHTVEQVLEQTLQTHGFDLHGYVLMPEHVHLLLSEPTQHPLATTLKVLKQETAKLLLRSHDHLWQARYYDFNVHTDKKRIEKLRYMHGNPVKRGLTTHPELYPWSSAHHYATGNHGTVTLHSYWTTRQSPTATPKEGAPFMTVSPS